MKETNVVTKQLTDSLVTCLVNGYLNEEKGDNRVEKLLVLSSLFVAQSGSKAIKDAANMNMDEAFDYMLIGCKQLEKCINEARELAEKHNYEEKTIVEELKAADGRN